MQKRSKREGDAALDWRDVGRQLEQKQKAFDEEMATLDVDAQSSEFKAILEDIHCENDLIAALRQAAKGDPTSIVDWLGSDRPLSSSFRRFLLDYFRGEFAPQRGEPRDDLRDMLTTYAERFFREWREENKRLGISDHGHRAEMREEAIRFTQERFFIFEKIDPEKVRDLMNRPRSRRR